MTRRLLFLLLWLILAACRQPERSALPANTPIILTVPETIAAGEPLTVIVGLDAEDGTAVTLLLNGSYGPRLFQEAVADERAIFAIPGSETQQSGLVTVTVAAGDTRGHAELTIVPGTAVAPVTPLVGARSIIADGAHWAMVIAVPHDQYGNPLAEGTPVEFRTLHPDGRLAANSRLVEHLLAWQRLWSGTVAGLTTVAAEASGRFGPEKELLEIPGWPRPFTLSVESGQFIADGRRLLTVRTGRIQDRFGNVMPDGTQVSFVVGGPNGQRIVSAVTLDGAAEAVLQAPDEPGDLTVRGSVFGVSSEPLIIPITTGILSESITVRTRVDVGAVIVHLEAGPLLGTLYQFVPDGTELLFVVNAPDGTSQTLTGVSEAGMAQAELRLDGLADGLYQVTAVVGGETGNGRFTLGER